MLELNAFLKPGWAKYCESKNKMLPIGLHFVTLIQICQNPNAESKTRVLCHSGI